MSFHTSKAAAFILIKFCLIDPGIHLLLILELLALNFFLVLPYLSYAFMSGKCGARIIVCLLHCNMSCQYVFFVSRNVICLNLGLIQFH